MKVWRDPRAIVGATDAGAHLDFLATFNYSTALLAEAVRKRGLLAIEEAVPLLTNSPARLYGLTERGRLAAGWHADIVVIDESTVGPAPVACASTSPLARRRLYGGADGIDHVLVNGTEIVETVSSPTHGPVVCCGRAATPRRSPFRAADQNEGSGSGATVRHTHTLPHRNGDGTTRGPPSRGGPCAPEAISGYRPDGDGRSAREEPTSEIRTGFSRQSRVRSERLEDEATSGAGHSHDCVLNVGQRVTSSVIIW